MQAFESLHNKATATLLHIIIRLPARGRLEGLQMAACESVVALPPRVSSMGQVVVGVLGANRLVVIAIWEDREPRSMPRAPFLGFHDTHVQLAAKCFTVCRDMREPGSPESLVTQPRFSKFCAACKVALQPTHCRVKLEAPHFMGKDSVHTDTAFT